MPLTSGGWNDIDMVDADHGPGGIMMQAVLDAQQEYADDSARADDKSDDEL